MPPDNDTLRRFLLGHLPPADAERVARDLDPAAVTLNAALDDTLLAALRVAPEPTPDPPEVCRLMASLERLPAAGPPDATAERPPTPNPSDATAATASGPDAAPHAPDADLADLLAPAEAPGEIGRLGGFRVLAILGKGGMGAVFAAEDPRLGRKVALKVMLPRVAASPAARGRFLREAKAAAAVEHENVIPIYHVGEDRGVPFLAMPLLPGKPLDARMEGGKPMRPADVVLVGGQIAEGLAAAHATGLIHRDVKPANVWLESKPDGAFRRVRLLDFGLARLARDDDRLTNSGAILGTPAYMAPEQARGEDVDARADVFSLGCVLYQMATGRRPFTGKDTFSVLTAIAVDTPPPPAQVNPAVPPRLSSLVTRMLAKTPDLRPQTARAVADELAVIAAGLAAGAVPVAEAVPMAEPAVGPHGTEVVPPAAGSATDWSVLANPAPAPQEAPAPRRRSPAVWWATAAAAVVLVGAAVLLAPTVIRIATNKGELVLEVDDPNLEVTVRQNGAVVADKTRNRTFVLTAGDGEVEFHDPDTGARAFTKTFRIERAGKTPLTAGMRDVADARPKPKSKPTPATKKTPDSPATAVLTPEQRKALEWVLANGGALSLKVGGEFRQILPGQPLPAGPFGVDRVVFAARRGFDDRAAAGLKDLPPITGILELQDTGLTDAGLRAVADSPGPAAASTLRLARTAVSDAGLESVARFAALEALDLRGTKVTTAGVKKLSAALPRCRIDGDGGGGVPGITPDPDRNAAEALRPFAELKLRLAPTNTVTVKPGDPLPAGPFAVTAVNFRFGGRLPENFATDVLLPAVAPLDMLGVVEDIGRRVGPVPEEFVARLADAPAGKTVWALKLDFPLTGQTLAALKRLPKLASVGFRAAGADDALLGRLAELKGLTNVTAWEFGAGGKATAAGRDALAGLPLTALSFPFAPVDADLCRRAAGMPRLVTLYLSDTDTTDAMVAELADARRLQLLGLSGTRVTDAGLGHLTTLANLHTLTLERTKVTEAGVRKLAAALPRCRIVWDGGVVEPTTPTAPAAEDPDRKAAEGVVSLGGQVRVAGRWEWVQTRADIPAGRIQITEIGLWKRPGVTDDGLAALAGCRKLARVTLGGTGVTDAGMPHLAKLPDLIHLDVDNTRVTDAGLAHFRGHPGFECLVLKGTKVTAAGLAHLGGGHRLMVLNLVGLPVGDDDLRWFTPAPELWELALADTRVTDAGLARFADCKKLGRLYLERTAVTDAGLALIRGWPVLGSLLLADTRVTDAGLAPLAGSKTLTHLNLERTKVTDAGLDHLRDCSRLEWLNLSGTRVTDAGLDKLAGSPGLRVIVLKGLQVTAAGAKRFAAATPRCKVEWDGGVVEPKRPAAP